MKFRPRIPAFFLVALYSALLYSILNSVVAFGTEAYEYPVEQDFIILEADSSQGMYFDPPLNSYPGLSYKEARNLKKLPTIKLADRRDWEILNRIAWQVFYDHIRSPSLFPANGKQIPARPSSQFSDHEYFWDQSFIYMGYARYAFMDPNTRGGLDAFYSVQHTDGFTPREILADGREVRFFPTQSLTLGLDSPPALPPGDIFRFRTVNRLYRYVRELLRACLYQDEVGKINTRVAALKAIYTDDNKNNPPLAAHAEWQHYLLSRDKDRLRTVIIALRKQTEWLEKNRMIQEGPLKGLFWQRTMASGMDNLPSQFNHWKDFQERAAEQENPDYGYLAAQKNDASFDISAQMKLHYDAMAAIEEKLDNQLLAKVWQDKSMNLRFLINHCMWDENHHFYFNVRETCKNKDLTFSLSGFWALYAQVADDYHVRLMLPYLSKPAFFNTYMPFATLAASHPQYSEDGHYWQGGVWPPLNYITMKGLMNYAHLQEAWNIALSGTERYLSLLYDTMTAQTNPARPGSHENLKHNLYEYNSPATGGPGKSPDAQGYFVGWAGLGPIALLQEVAIGINIHDSEIVWYLNRNDMHGIEHLNIGDGHLSIQVNKHLDGSPLEEHHFSIEAEGLQQEGVEHIRVIEKVSGQSLIIPISSI